jgi:hypothetical protein
MKEKTFVYGMSVEGANFTDREQETKRMVMDFKNGINVILISPRRMGKTSLVKRVQKEMQPSDCIIVMMDIYDCRSEYDFLNRFAESVLKATSSKMEQFMENVKKFLIRLTPKISFGEVPGTDFSFSLGITPSTYKPEEILQLPEVLARENNKRIVVCIDEFQQIGEMGDSITIQKRIRGVWQHQQNVSYCLFGSKKHLMSNLFQNKRMPFYMFGEMIYLDRIPTEKWVPFIISRFKSQGMIISSEKAVRICETVDNYSSYVQQLAWNVMAETDKEVTDQNIEEGISTLLQQCNSLFVQQTEGLTSYQLNFIRALCSGIHIGFGEKNVLERFPLGTKSNISRIKMALIQREIIDENKGSVFLTDKVFESWFKREFM